MNIKHISSYCILSTVQNCRIQGIQSWEVICFPELQTICVCSVITTRIYWIFYMGREEASGERETRGEGGRKARDCKHKKRRGTRRELKGRGTWNWREEKLLFSLLWPVVNNILSVLISHSLWWSYGCCICSRFLQACLSYRHLNSHTLVPEIEVLQAGEPQEGQSEGSGPGWAKAIIPASLD